MNVGDIVFDDLTAKKCALLEIDIDKNGNIGYRVDSAHLDGWRHPWEVTMIGEEE